MAPGPLLLDELAGGGLGAEEHTVEVDRNHRAPAIGRELEAGRGDAGAVIVDHHIEAAEVLDRLGHQRVARLGVAHVAHGHLALATGLADSVAHGLEMAGVAARDQHRRSAQRELARDHGADSGAAAGYDCDLAFNAEYVFQESLRPDNRGSFVRAGSIASALICGQPRQRLLRLLGHGRIGVVVGRRVLDRALIVIHCLAAIAQRLVGARQVKLGLGARRAGGDGILVVTERFGRIRSPQTGHRRVWSPPASRICRMSPPAARRSDRRAAGPS